MALLEVLKDYSLLQLHTVPSVSDADNCSFYLGILFIAVTVTRLSLTTPAGQKLFLLLYDRFYRLVLFDHSQSYHGQLISVIVLLLTHMRTMHNLAFKIA